MFDKRLSLSYQEFHCCDHILSKFETDGPMLQIEQYPIAKMLLGSSYKMARWNQLIWLP